jgi:hypothetical protein
MTFWEACSAAVTRTTRFHAGAGPVKVNLDIGPTKNLSLLFQGEAIGVSSRFDSVYNSGAGVVVKPPSHGFTINRIGDAFDASAKYRHVDGRGQRSAQQRNQQAILWQRDRG